MSTSLVIVHFTENFCWGPVLKLTTTETSLCEVMLVAKMAAWSCNGGKIAEVVLVEEAADRRGTGKEDGGSKLH